jgi:hypothetical protein
MSKTSKGIFAFFLFRTLDRYRQVLLSLAKIKAAMCYVEVVRQARLLVSLVILLAASIGLMTAGFIFIHAAIVLAAPWTVQEKAIFLLICGIVYLSVPLAAILIGMSSKRWMKQFKADEVVEKALHQPRD